jgi:hypothetical protein
MDDAGIMSGFEAIERLNDHVERHARGHRADERELSAKVAAAEQLHREEGAAIAHGSEIEDIDEVSMAKLRQDACFFAKSRGKVLPIVVLMPEHLHDAGSA